MPILQGREYPLIHGLLEITLPELLPETPTNGEIMLFRDLIEFGCNEADNEMRATRLLIPTSATYEGIYWRTVQSLLGDMMYGFLIHEWIPPLENGHFPADFTFDMTDEDYDHIKGLLRTAANEQ